MRESGYYWVKIKKEYSPKNNNWQIAEWKDGLYFITGYELYYNDSDFEGIDERRIVKNYMCRCCKEVIEIETPVFCPDCEDSMHTEYDES